MINLTSSGGTITFAFDNNSGYLQNGTIEVPVNSLSLVIDESDMVTFKKANSNDVFVSALASDFGMSKAQLISFYKDNMVGSTGGGGVTSGEVQTMIDESISGKADTSAATINISEDVTTTGRNIFNSFTFDYDAGVYYLSAITSNDMNEDFKAFNITMEDVSGNTVSITKNTSTGETDSYILEGGIVGWECNRVLTTKGSYRITNAVFFEDNLINYEYKAKINEEKAVSTVITDEIEPALSAKADTSAVTESINAAVSGKADYSAATVNISEDVTTTGRSRYEQFNIDYSNNVYYISAIFDEGYEGFTIGLKDSPSGNTIFVSNSTSAGETDSYIFTKDSSSFELTTKGSYKITSVLLLPESDYVNYTYIASNNVEKAVSTVITDDIYPALSGKADTSAVTQSINEAVSGKLDTSIFETYSGNVETALSGKQDTLSAGTNITISGNVISAEGGGKAIEAGRGISITTGETADTVSFNLPISAGTGDNALLIASDTYDISNKAKGNYSVSFNGGGLHPNYAYGTSSLAQGMDTKAYGTACHSEGYGSKAGVQNNINIQYSHAEGDHTEAKGTASHAEGSYTIANNLAEHASGRYNNSVSASTTFGDSGNTLFSVGNGTASNARHNAFEIRQNGDIYLTLNGQDVKLQDNLGGGVSSGEVETMISAATSGYTARFAEDEEVTAAGLNALNDKFGGLKLMKITQAAYNALTVKDNNTLYIISD